MAHAHMAIGIDDVLAGEDAVGDHEVAHQGGEVGHGGSEGGGRRGGGGECPTLFFAKSGVQLGVQLP